MINLKDILLDIVFTGFSIALLICAIGMIFLKRKIKVIIGTGIQTALEIVKISGILYLLYIVTMEIFSFTKYEYSLLHRIHGEYSWGFIIIVLAIPFLHSCFGSKKLEKHQ
jgi:hypothetical protein